MLSYNWPVTKESMYLVTGAVMLLSVACYFWRRTTARGIAQRWLEQNHYRTFSIRTLWFRTFGFRPVLLRNSNNAFDFIATIDDRDLGGAGQVRVRVWLDWFGNQMGDVEIMWDRIPKREEGGAKPLMDRLADAQLDVLRRVAVGETTFYAPKRGGTEARDFDDLIEHVFALSARGMLSHAAPVEDGRRGLRYSSIGSLAMTSKGREWLESQSSGADSSRD